MGHRRRARKRAKSFAPPQNFIDVEFFPVYFMRMTRPYRRLTGMTVEQKLERQKAQMRAWREKNPVSKKEWMQKNGGWAYEKRHRDMEKVRTRQALRRAVRSGKMVRGPCAICGASETHGHHADYSKPYDVTWLCRKCHDMIHASEKHRQKEPPQCAR